ncbi:hypothetical protein ACFX1Z_024415 [Malus domestica]
MLRKNNDGNAHHFANVAGIVTPSCDVNPVAPHSHLGWIIDSGATDHVTASSPLLNPSYLPHTATIQTPDGSQTSIESISSLQVTPNLKLDHVLKVPKFKVNLLSVSKLTRALNCVVIFFPEFCVVQDVSTRRMIGLGKRHNDLYYLTPEQNPKLAYNILRHSNPGTND